jgi:protocatechuate 3,4-dioxygenase beta subunit
MNDNPLAARRPLSRRTVLSLIGGGIGTAFAVACGGGRNSSVSSSSGSSSGDGSCSEIAEETNGPFPADGSQAGVTNVLADSRVLRSDITADFDGSDVQDGVPLTLAITLEDVSNSCALLEGAAVYIWHCNADGEYSVYSSGNNGNHSGQTFLRGAQVSNSSGQVTFTTIYPGRYAGRATHIHVEIYADDSFNTLLKTSQFAFPDDHNDTVYNASAYSESDSTTQTGNDSDNVFSDGYDEQMLSIAGSNGSGYTATITIGIVT